MRFWTTPKLRTLKTTQSATVWCSTNTTSTKISRNRSTRGDQTPRRNKKSRKSPLQYVTSIRFMAVALIKDLSLERWMNPSLKSKSKWASTKWTKTKTSAPRCSRYAALPTEQPRTQLIFKTKPQVSRKEERLRLKLLELARGAFETPIKRTKMQGLRLIAVPGQAGELWAAHASFNFRPKRREQLKKLFPRLFRKTMRAQRKTNFKKLQWQYQARAATSEFLLTTGTASLSSRWLHIMFHNSRLFSKINHQWPSASLVHSF